MWCCIQGTNTFIKEYSTRQLRQCFVVRTSSDMRNELVRKQHIEGMHLIYSFWWMIIQWEKVQYVLPVNQPGHGIRILWALWHADSVWISLKHAKLYVAMLPTPVRNALQWRRNKLAIIFCIRHFQIHALCMRIDLLWSNSIDVYYQDSNYKTNTLVYIIACCRTSAMPLSEVMSGRDHEPWCDHESGPVKCNLNFDFMPTDICDTTDNNDFIGSYTVFHKTTLYFDEQMPLAEWIIKNYLIDSRVW